MRYYEAMRAAAIRAIEYHLPDTVITSDRLAREFPEWSVQKIEEKTGISERHVVGTSECASDLAVEAAKKLFASGRCSPNSIDYLLLCTQSPDYFLPTTACLIQDRLKIPTKVGALDFNLGCSGFVYGLGLAQGLIETGQAESVLLLTAETYSKFIHPKDKSVRTLFGDAATATLIQAMESECRLLGPYQYGTDGSGGPNLIVPAGGMRHPKGPSDAVALQDEEGNWRAEENLHMNGPEIFNFTLRMVPKCVDDLLAKASAAVADIDYFVFHQANKFMLEHLRKRLKIPPENFPMEFRACGNTVSSTIPIVLAKMLEGGKLHSGQRLMLVGFGVGYSWGSMIVRWY